MGRKKQTGADLTSIKLGTRVRHTADGVEGRIIWANAVAVKIEWDDGEKVTWKRAELPAKGLEILAEDEKAEEPRTVGGLPLRPVFRSDGRRVLVTVPPRDEELTEAQEPHERAEDAATEPASEPQAAPAAAEPAEAPAPEPTSADLPQEPAATPTGAEATATPEARGDQPEAPAEAPSAAPAPPVSAEPETTPAKPAKKRTKRATPAEPKAAKLSALDAAAKVLAEHGQPMGCQELIGAMAVKGYWSSPGGKTPATTLYSAILRELQTKGDAARFVKVGKGQFALRPQS